MQKISRAAAIGALLLVTGAAPALAQYEPTTTTTRPTTTTTRPATTTTRPVTTTTRAPATTAAPTTTPATVRDGSGFQTDSSVTATSQAPATSIVKPEPIRQEIQAGDTLEVTANTGDVTFDAEEAPAVTLSETGDDAETIRPTVTVSVNAETGELEIAVEVPPDTPTSILTVTITAVDSRGQTRTLVYLLSVKGASRTTDTTIGDELSRPRTAATAGGTGLLWSELPVVPPAEVPEIVHQIQSAIPDDATEQALLADLAAEPSSVLDVDYDVDGAVLAVSVRPLGTTDDESTRPLVAALAVAVAGGGLLVLRRNVPPAKLVKGSR